MDLAAALFAGTGRKLRSATSKMVAGLSRPLLLLVVVVIGAAAAAAEQLQHAAAQGPTLDVQHKQVGAGRMKTP
jgi:hypothetical protein